MRQIEIEGEKYLLKGRLGQITKLLKKYNLITLKNGEWGDDESLYINFVLESTWRLIQRKRLFKPYVFFFIFKKFVVFDELMAAQKDVMGILYGLSEEKQNSIFEAEEKTAVKQKKKIAEAV